MAIRPYRSKILNLLKITEISGKRKAQWLYLAIPNS